MTLSVSAVTLSLAAACSLLTVPAQAQFPPPHNDGNRQAPPASVHGEVSGTGYYPGRTLSVELRSNDGYSTSAEVSGSNTFDFGGIPSGTYQLTVVDRRGEVLYTDMINVPNPAVNIHLREPHQPERPVNGTISLSRLEHKVPDKAIKEFNRAESAVKKDDREKGIEHLERALEIDPEFMEAYNNLGVQFLKLGNNEKALDAFDHAAKLDPGSAKAAANCAAALYNLKRYKEAELAARRAVEKDGGLAQARYALGMSLAAADEKADEAVYNLRLVTEQFPPARLVLAQLLEKKGETGQAREQLENYLSASNVPNREKVEQWLKELTPQ